MRSFLQAGVICASSALAVCLVQGVTGCGDDTSGGAATTDGTSATTGTGGAGGEGGHDALAMSCGLDPVAQATEAGEPCDAIAPKCPAAPTANYRNLFNIETCSFKPSIESECTPSGDIVCTSVHGADYLFVIADGGSACPSPAIGDLHIILGEPGPAGAIGGTWELSEASAEPECAPAGRTESGVIDLAGVCCATEVDVELPLHDLVFRFRVQRDWESVAVAENDGGTSTSCPDVCAHVAALCGADVATGCTESCASLTEAERACMSAAQACPEVSACAAGDGP